MFLQLIAIVVSFASLLSAMELHDEAKKEQAIVISPLTDLCLKTISNHEIDSEGLPQHYKQLIKKGLIRHNCSALWADAAAKGKIEREDWSEEPDGLVALSADGSFVVIVCYDNIARVWDLKAGKLLCSFSDHNDFVISVAIPLDDSCILTKSSNDKVKMWRAKTGQLIKTIAAESTTEFANLSNRRRNRGFFVIDRDKIAVLERGQPNWYVFKDTFIMLNLEAKSSDGSFIVCRSETNRNCIEIFDTKTKKIICRLGGFAYGHADEITAVAISPDNTFIATGSKDKTVKLWDAKTGKLIGTLSGHTTGTISSITIDPSNTCITILCDRAVAWWRANYIYLWKISGFVNSLLDEKVSPEDVLKIINTHSSGSRGKDYCAIQ